MAAHAEVRVLAGQADPTTPLDIARYARNPRIARVWSDLGITQERGEGIRRMFEEMRLVGLTDPHYHQTSGRVRLTLTALRRMSAEQQAALPRGAEEILAVLRRSEKGPAPSVRCVVRSAAAAAAPGCAPRTSARPTAPRPAPERRAAGVRSCYHPFCGVVVPSMLHSPVVNWRCQQRLL